MASTARSYGPLIFAPFVALALLGTVAFALLFFGRMAETTATDTSAAAGAAHLADASTPALLENAVTQGATPLSPGEVPVQNAPADGPRQVPASEPVAQ